MSLAKLSAQMRENLKKIKDYFCTISIKTTSLTRYRSTDWECEGFELGITLLFSLRVQIPATAGSSEF